MINHLDKNISSIQYNFLNLPRTITQSTGSTAYVYRADGLKVKKTYGTKVTDYLDGFQYENNSLQFLPTAEGYYDFANSRYVYNYTDHLGNVRVSYFRNATTGSAQVLEENNYYPFGLKHTGYNGLTGNPSYQYKYNGKELQETGMYDYGARFYMPDLGRWGVADELSEKFSSNSNYNYVGNNPILIYDPDGRDWYYTNDGQYLYNKDLNRNNASQFFKDNNIEGAKYAFASNLMGSMNYAADGYVYDDSAAGGGKAVEDGTLHNIEEVVLTSPGAIEKRNIEAARSRLHEAIANYWGGYAYGMSFGYTYGNTGYNLTLVQNFGTGQAKLFGTASAGLVKESYGFNFQLNALSAYGTNTDGSRNTDVFGGALGASNEVSGSYIFGGAVSKSAAQSGLGFAPNGTITTSINLGPSVGGGISRTHTTDLTPALNRFLQFNWVQHKPQFD